MKRGDYMIHVSKSWNMPIKIFINDKELYFLNLLINRFSLSKQDNSNVQMVNLLTL
jgi:hypothetical protein